MITVEGKTYTLAEYRAPTKAYNVKTAPKSATWKYAGATSTGTPVWEASTGQRVARQTAPTQKAYEKAKTSQIRQQQRDVSGELSRMGVVMLV